MQIFLCKTDPPTGHRGGGFGVLGSDRKSLLTCNLGLRSWGLLVPLWLSREGELKRPPYAPCYNRGHAPQPHLSSKGAYVANAIDQLTDRVLVLGRLTIVRRAITAVAVTISAVLQTFLDPGIHSARRPASERPHRRRGPARSRYLARRRSHRHLARYARAQHPRGAPMLERH